MKTKTKSSSSSSSSSNHTPGPWRYRGPNERWTDGPRAQVFGPPHPVDGGDYAALATLSNPADARLIAAAPDLLAACEAALMGTAFDESWRDKCHSAIAKARGEKS